VQKYFWCQAGRCRRQGNVKVISKPVNLIALSKNKIPNLKHQMTNKSQNTMTKTIMIRVWYWFLYPGLPIVMPIGTCGSGSLVWDFEFG
jgi:hypothetical protein